MLSISIAAFIFFSLFAPNTAILQVGAEYAAVPAGSVMDLRIDPEQDAIQPGGTWKAEAGTFHDAIYTAPTYLPASSGIDRITYTDPMGNTAEVDVRILSDSDFPSSYDYLIVWRSLPRGDLRHDPVLSERLDAIEPGVSFKILFADEEPPAPLDLTGMEPISREMIGVEEGYRLPSAFTGADDPDVIFARADTGLQKAKQPQKIRRVPFHPDLRPDDPCRPPGQRHTSKDIDQSVNISGWEELGSVEVFISGRLSAQIKKLFGIELEAGAKWRGLVKMRTFTYKQVRKEDIYECRNGTWVLVDQRVCVRYGTGIETIPNWYALTQGYPANGNPNTWPMWSCTSQ